MSETVHVVLALILTLMLICQAWVLAAVLGSYRVLATQRQARFTELVWIALPVAVMLVLAARSWIVALDMGALAMAGVAPVEVSAQPSSPSVLHR